MYIFCYVSIRTRGTSCELIHILRDIGDTPRVEDDMDDIKYASDIFIGSDKLAPTTSLRCRTEVTC